MIPALRHRRIIAVLAAATAAWLVAGTALAHASLVSSDPAEGSSVPFPPSISLTFDDDLDAAKSQFQVIDATGAAVATGHVTAADPKTMQATGLALTWGACQVRWTAVASDGDLTRGTVSFFVIQQGGLSIAPSAGAGVVAGSSSPVRSDGGAGSIAPASGDVVLPIAAALVLVAVAGVVLLRRGRAA